MAGCVRKATLDDAPALEILIAASVRGLQTADYTAEQREAAIGEVFGVDTRLILEGTYFVVEPLNGSSRVVALEPSKTLSAAK